MSLSNLKSRYLAGENIMARIKTHPDSIPDRFDAVEVAYDLQAGSYVKGLESPQIRDHKIRYAEKIAAILDDLPGTSLLEAGVGEATTLRYLLDQIPARLNCIHGFDLSWSRIHIANQFLAQENCSSNPNRSLSLCVGDMHHIPFRDHSFDVVFTSHAIEPNGGREKPLLNALARVSRRWLLLVEPAYEFANEEARKRMDHHGYCRGLAEIAQEIGLKVVRHELLHEDANPLNPSALLLLEKTDSPEPSSNISPQVACPLTQAKLKPEHGGWWTPEEFLFYPELMNIPLLTPSHAVLASGLDASHEHLTA